MSNTFRLSFNGRYLKYNGQPGFIEYEVEDPTEYLDKFYPVGTYYETTVGAFDPNVSWVGTWVRDSDGLVLKSGISPETTGGEITHTLTVAELPSHSHRTTRQMMAAGRVSTATRGNDHFTGRYYDWTYVYNSGTTQPYKSGNRTSSGPTNTSSGHNNVQKSMICYRWHRVA